MRWWPAWSAHSFLGFLIGLLIGFAGASLRHPENPATVIGDLDGSKTLAPGPPQISWNGFSIPRGYESTRSPGFSSPGFHPDAGESPAERSP